MIKTGNIFITSTIYNCSRHGYLICSSRGPKEVSLETNLDILYIIFALHGETAIILGFCNPMISIIFEHKRLVAVAVNTNNVLLQELCCAPHRFLMELNEMLFP